MKLSEAGALGRMLLPKLRAYNFWYPGGGGCWQGAALEAIGKRKKLAMGNLSVFYAEWPWVHKQIQTPCSCSMGKMSVEAAITHLFDTHVIRKKDWTYVQVTDWVRSVEPEEPSNEQPSEKICGDDTIAVSVPSDRECEVVVS